MAFGMAIQPLCRLLPIAEMGAHQGFPEPAVVGDAEVQEFMHDHIVPETGVEAEQICAEVETDERGQPASRNDYRTYS